MCLSVESTTAPSLPDTSFAASYLVQVEEEDGGGAPWRWVEVVKLEVRVVEEVEVVEVG